MSDSPFAEFAAGAAIVREGEAARAMYIIESGRVEIRSSRWPQPLGELGPGEVVGEMALLQEQPHSATATARTAVRALCIDQASFHAVLRENPEVAVQLMRQLVLRLRAVEQRGMAAGPAAGPSAPLHPATPAAAPPPAAPGPAPAPTAPAAAKEAAAAAKSRAPRPAPAAQETNRPAKASAAAEAATPPRGTDTPVPAAKAQDPAPPSPATQPASAPPPAAPDIAVPPPVASSPAAPPAPAPPAATATPVPAPATPAPATPPPATPAPATPAPATPAPPARPDWAVRHGEDEIRLAAQRDQWLIGRPDPATGQVPEVDLGALDVARSLSRRHARLCREGDQLLLREEPGVANGTWVNGERLAAGAAVVLKPGDRLRFGAVEVEFVAR